MEATPKLTARVAHRALCDVKLALAEPGLKRWIDRLAAIQAASAASGNVGAGN